MSKTVYSVKIKLVCHDESKIKDADAMAAWLKDLLSGIPTATALLKLQGKVTCVGDPEVVGVDDAGQDQAPGQRAPELTQRERSLSLDWARGEKTMMQAMAGISIHRRLQYPVRKLALRNGGAELEYVMPDREREAYVRDFMSKYMHRTDDKYFNLHSEKVVNVRDMKVVCADGWTFVVMPDYETTEGMAIDAVPLDVLADGKRSGVLFAIAGIEK